jgi:hypothetical protein
VSDSSNTRKKVAIKPPKKNGLRQCVNIEVTNTTFTKKTKFKQNEIYISGKMRGLPEEESRKKFEAAQHLIELGHDVVNPWAFEKEKEEQKANDLTS